MLLNLEDDIEVVGGASDGSTAVDLVASLVPDVVLMDVRMPKRSGIEACVAIRDVAPNVRIILLTVSDAEADLYDTVKNHVRNILEKLAAALADRGCHVRRSREVGGLLLIQGMQRPRDSNP
jgi:DNA-binding NarL/FixJ family response regulator